MNWEYIELIAGNIKRIVDFLNSLNKSCRSHLSILNGMLMLMYFERKLDHLETCVVNWEDRKINELTSSVHLYSIEQ